MDEHQHHQDLINAFYKEQRELFDHSEQGIYVYLDDIHKICNKKFATLLDLESAEEWAETEGSFPDLFVARESQGALVSAYQDAMEKKIGSVNEIVWKKKSGKTVKTKVILIPISFQRHLFALHFVFK